MVYQVRKTLPAPPHLGRGCASAGTLSTNILKGGSCAGLTLAITWPLGVLGEEDSHAVAAQVHGDVILLFTLY